MLFTVRELPSEKDLPSMYRFDADVECAMGSVNAAGAVLVEVIGRCLDSGWWQAEATHSPEHWVMARCGLGRARARKLVAIARELGDYPETARAFAAGQLTEDHVYVIVTRCDPARDGDIVVPAPHCNIAQLSRLVRFWPKPEPEVEDEPAVEPVECRDVVALGWGEDGRYRGHLDVGAELGALVDKTMRSARSKLFGERHPDHVLGESEGETRVSWSDALGRVCEDALETLDGSTRRGRTPGDRFQVLLHLDATHPERVRVDGGPVLSRAEAEYLSCDSAVRPILWRDSRPVNKGRRTRVIDPVLRAVIEERDQGCRLCGRRGFLHIHHLVHWTRGGPTDDDNLIALCTTCHRHVHTGAVRIIGDPTRVDGLELLDRHDRQLRCPAARSPDQPPTGPRYAGPIRGQQITWRYFPPEPITTTASRSSTS